MIWCWRAAAAIHLAHVHQQNNIVQPQPARHCQFLCEITSTKSKVNQIYREKCFCVWFWKLFKSCKLWQVSGVNSITKRGSSGVTFVTDSYCWLLMAIMGVPRLLAGSMNVWRVAVAYLLPTAAALLIFLEFVKSFMDILICGNFCSIFPIFLAGKKKKPLDEQTRSLSRSATASWGIL